MQHGGSLRKDGFKNRRAFPCELEPFGRRDYSKLGKASFRRLKAKYVTKDTDEPDLDSFEGWFGIVKS